MDGQAERTIQTLEDILRAFIIDFKGNWDKHFPSVEFAYNNRFYSSISMAPYEALIVGGAGLLLDSLKWVRLHFLAPT